ncbi:MAG TPA: hypothetical protein VN611_12005 [Patescibacteria group bacterium]|nr:hypothetical protein [Patescibacteria group bacterium]
MAANSVGNGLMTKEQAYSYARFSLLTFMEKGQVSEELMKNILREIYWNFSQIPQQRIEENAQMRYDQFIGPR